MRRDAVDVLHIRRVQPYEASDLPVADAQGLDEVRNILFPGAQLLEIDGDQRVFPRRNQMDRNQT